MTLEIERIIVDVVIWLAGVGAGYGYIGQQIWPTAGGIVIGLIGIFYGTWRGRKA